MSIRLLCQVSCASCLRWIPLLPEQTEWSAAAHGPPGPAMQRRSVAPERYLPLPPGWVLMSGRLIADYETAACWEYTSLAGSNIFMFSCAQTWTSPSPPHRRDPSAWWIPDEHQPPPRGAAPLSPGSAAWHSARCLPLSCGQGNYPSFCVYVCECWCVCFAPACDAFTGTIFHICFLFWQWASQPPVR